MERSGKKAIKQFIALFVIILILLQSILVNAEGDASSTASLDYMQSVINMIKDKYNGGISDEQLLKGAIRGMFGTMDPYTTFYTPEEAESFIGGLNGSFTGIGIAVEKSGDDIFVSKVFADSPAKKSGILQGDIIKLVNGKSTEGLGTGEVSSLITGESGTAVKVSVMRGDNKNFLVYTIKRAEIVVNPVFSEIRSNIGYIRIDIFNANTAECFAEAIEQFDENKILKIILDLRNNPGGEVNQAIEIARYFIPSGIIATLDFKSESLQDTVYRSDLDKPKYKLTVLVNGMSASASEIITGAVQDTKAGTIIGTKTFGKAKIQSILPILTQEAFEKYSKQLGVKLADGYDLYSKYGVAAAENEIAGYTKITSGFYYTPKGRLIDGTGIVPDIFAVDSDEVLDIESRGKLNGKTTLRSGSKGYDVLITEKLLKISGYFMGTPDFIFDEKTLNAVTQFQAAANVKKDGIIGPVTRKALNNELDKVLLKYDLQYSKAVEFLSK